MAHNKFRAIIFLFLLGIIVLFISCDFDDCWFCDSGECRTCKGKSIFLECKRCKGERYIWEEGRYGLEKISCMSCLGVGVVLCECNGTRRCQFCDGKGHR